MNKKTLIWIGIGVAAIVAYKYFTKPSTKKVDGAEEMSNASGIQCQCRRPDGSYTAKTCRTAGTSVNCEVCCGHYGFRHEGFGY